MLTHTPIAHEQTQKSCNRSCGQLCMMWDNERWGCAEAVTTPGCQWAHVAKVFLLILLTNPKLLPVGMCTVWLHVMHQRKGSTTKAEQVFPARLLLLTAWRQQQRPLRLTLRYSILPLSQHAPFDLKHFHTLYKNSKLSNHGINSCFDWVCFGVFHFFNAANDPGINPFYTWTVCSKTCSPSSEPKSILVYETQTPDQV